MDQVMKSRGLWLALAVLFFTVGLPALAQNGIWTVTFAPSELNAASTKPFSGGNLPAGRYKVEYVSGALDYWLDSPDAIDYGLTAGEAGKHWPITHSNGTVIDGPDDGELKVKTVAEIEQAVGGAFVEFDHDGTSDISISFFDDPYDNNALGGGVPIVWRLSRVDDKARLQILVGDGIDPTDTEEVAANNALGEKPGGHELPTDGEKLQKITGHLPDGYTNATVHLDFAALPEGVAVFSDAAATTEITDNDEVTGPISGADLVIYIRAPEEGFEPSVLDLYCVHDSTSAKNSADESGGGATSVPVCPDYTTVSAGGCDCVGSSCTGESSGTVGCLEFRIGLASIGFTDQAGYMQLMSRYPSRELSQPGSLQFFLSSRLQTVKGAGNTGPAFTEDGDKIEHAGAEDAAWGEAVLTLHGDGYGYDIKFYEDVDGTLATTPYRTVTVENLNDLSSYDELYITEEIALTGSTPKTRMWHFEWDQTLGDDGGWVLSEGEAVATVAGPSDDTVLRITERAESWNSAGDEVTETITVKEAGGTVVSKTQEVCKIFDWGRERLSRTMDPDTTAADQQLKETWTYYDDLANDGDNYGRLKSYLSETGYWERYEYDADGNVSKTMRQHEDEALNTSTAFATVAAANIVEEYTEHDSVSVTFGGGSKAVYVEEWQIKVAGTVERTWYMVYIDEADSSVSGCTEEWSVRPVTKDPENGTTLAAVIEDVLDGTDTASLVTKTWRWEEGATGIGDNDPYDVRMMQSPDGQYTVYERTNASDERTTVVRRGFSDDSLSDILSGAGGADIEYGTKTTSVVDTRGNMVSTLNEKVSESDNAGAWFITSLMKADVTDEFGRPTVTEYFFGQDAADEAATPGSGAAAYDTTITYGCCGGGSEETRAGRDGVQTRTLDDVLGRNLYTKRWHGIIGIDPLYSVNEYDAAGRTIASGLTTDEDLDDPEDLRSSRTYDLAGRMDSATDEEGRKSYTTYRRIDTDGSAFTGTVGTDAFYWETRRYGNDKDFPVSVTWTDSHGRTVLSYVGSCTAFAGAGGVPSGGEALTEHSRSTSIYDWENRMTEGRAYFNIASLAKDAPGTQGTNYLVTGTTEYDALGRAFRTTDAAGNITETVYEDGTGRSIKTLIGVDVADLHTVSRVYYNKFSGSAPTGDDRPWPTRVYTVKPGLTAAPDDSDLDDSSPTFTNYTYTETVEAFDITSNYLVQRWVWSRPEYGPWTRQTTDEEGRPSRTAAYKNNDTSTLLTRVDRVYWDSSDASNGKLSNSRQYRVDSGAATSNYLETSYFYDDAGRSVKSETAGRGFTKTSYDDYGRTERTAFGSYEGSTSDATNFTADTLLTETVPTYDKSGRVTQTVTYQRAHDATATGLLSAAAADQSRASYAYTWFDDNGRQTHSATAGTDSSYTYNAGTPIEPNSSDDRLVSKVEYDGAGRAYLTTDNLGRKTLLFFDDLGRVTHRVESWDGLVDGNGDPTLDPDTPGSRSTDVNRITKHVYDNSATGGGARTETVAIDPSGDGTTTSDDQATHYIHSGEVNASERGPIPVNGRPIAVLMPDAVEDGTTRANAITEINAGGEVFGDFTYTEYFANGQVQRTTDQRGVKITSSYSAEGWLDSQQVLTASGATWTPVGDQSMIYTHGDAGETLTVSAYADDNFAQISSKLTYTYDGFYNVTEEKQDHDPASGGGTGDPKTISWAYDTTVANNIYAKAYRLDTVTYPNGRVIQLKYDGHVVDGYSIDDRIGRADSIEEDASGADIVSYRYLGSGRMVRKDYPFSGGTSGGVRLDMIDEGSEGSDANDDYEVSLDAFGRPTRYQWEQYDSNGDADGGLVHFAHAYDRNSNRLYDERKTARHTGFSKVYDRDGLDRINSSLRGILADSAGTKVVERPRLKEVYELDALGNPTEIEFKGKDPYVRNITHNDANELGTREVYEQANSAQIGNNFDSDTSSEWFAPGSDTFDIDTTTPGHLQPLSVTADSINGTTESAAHGLFLWGPEFGPLANETYITFKTGITTTTRAGFVFGYEDPHNYWIVALKYVPGGQSRQEICQVVNGTLTVMASANRTITLGTQTGTHLGSTRSFIENSGLAYHFGSSGFPVGRVGVYTDSAEVEFNNFRLWPKDKPSDLAGRWDRWSSSWSFSTALTFHNNDISRHYPTFLRGVTTPAGEPWRVTFMMHRSTASRNQDAVRFLFNVTEHDSYSALRVQHSNAVQPTSGDEFTEGGSVSVSGTKTDANFVTAANHNDPVWVRVTYDGTSTVKAYMSSTEAGLDTQVSSGNDAYTSTGFDMTGGGIGFRARYGQLSIKHVKVETDADDDGAYAVEYEQDITAWAEYEPVEHEHDASGNLTYDGEKRYAYDAYNRLVRVQNAYRNGSSVIVEGSTLAAYAYDGSGRRIRKDVYLGGVLDRVEHVYYHGWSAVETRNGSDQVTQQHVWDNLAGHYIDSLAQVANNTTPGTNDTCDQALYALQDVQFNVMAIVDGTGAVVERYEYTLYGQRMLKTAAYAPLSVSAYGVQVGFQGLRHDDETETVENRRRIYLPRLGRFIQRDPHPEIYPDGMNTYAAYHVMQMKLDPMGMAWTQATATEQVEKTRDKWREEGSVLAANLLDHFLTNTGTDYEYTEEDWFHVHKEARDKVEDYIMQAMEYHFFGDSHEVVTTPGSYGGPSMFAVHGYTWEDGHYMFTLRPHSKNKGANIRWERRGINKHMFRAYGGARLTMSVFVDVYTKNKTTYFKYEARSVTLRDYYNFKSKAAAAADTTYDAAKWLQDNNCAKPFWHSVNFSYLNRGGIKIGKNGERTSMSSSLKNEKSEVVKAKRLSESSVR